MKFSNWRSRRKKNNDWKIQFKRPVKHYETTLAKMEYQKRRKKKSVKKNTLKNND